MWALDGVIVLHSFVDAAEANIEEEQDDYYHGEQEGTDLLTFLSFE